MSELSKENQEWFDSVCGSGFNYDIEPSEVKAKLLELESQLQQPWISVEDSSPNKSHGTHCLIYRPDSLVEQGSKIEVVPIDLFKIFSDATHWMEIKPPKGSE